MARTISFADLSDKNSVFADGVANFGVETLTPNAQIQYHRLLAIVGDGDKQGEPGETGYVLSRFASDGRTVNTLSADNGAGDPVRIRAHGKTSNSSAGDLTAAVVFSNADGFGLAASGENSSKAALLNGGDSLDFAVQPIGGAAQKLGSFAFVVDLQGQSGTVTIALDVDGSILTRSGGAWGTNAKTSLTGLRNNDSVVIDAAAHVVKVNGVPVGVQGAFWTAFEASGADNITIGAPHDESKGFSLRDVVIVAQSGEAPHAVDDVNGLQEDGAANVAGNVLSNDTDPNGDTLTVSAVNGAAAKVGVAVAGAYGSVTLQSNGNYVYIPNYALAAVQKLGVGQSVVDNFTYTAHDPSGLTSTATLAITINGADDTPVVTAPPSQQAYVGALFTLVLPADTFTDVDQNDTLTRVALLSDGSPLPPWLTFNATTRTLQGTPPVGAPASLSIQLKATDLAGASSAALFNLQIGAASAAPVVISFADLSDKGSVFADGVAHFGPETLNPGTQTQYHRLLAIVGDGDQIGEPGETGHVLSKFASDTVTANSLGADNGASDPVKITARGLTSATTVGDRTGAVTYTNKEGFGLGNSTDNANKSLVLNKGDALDFALQPVDGQPRILKTVSFTVLPQQSDAVALAIDTDGATLTTSGAVATDAKAILTGLHNQDKVVIDFAAHSVTVNGVARTDISLDLWAAFDAAGGDNITLGAPLAETKGFSLKDLVIVTAPGNHAPIAHDDATAVIEDIATVATGNVRTNDSDPDGDSLAVTPGAFALAHGSLVLLANGDFTYTLDNSNPAVQALNTGQALADSFTYTVGDGHGGTATAALNITIQGQDELNQPPRAVLDEANITEDSAPNPVVGNVLTNDTDPNGDTLSVTNAGTIAMPHGTLVIHADGFYSYLLDNANADVQALNAGDSLVDTFTYHISDGHGGTDANKLMIRIHGADDNHAPVAAADANVITEDVAGFATGNVLANDSDTDGNPLAVTVSGVFTLGHGTLSLASNGDYSYALDNGNAAVQALNDGDTLTDTYSYTVSDGHGGTDAAVLSITINGADEPAGNTAPIAAADVNSVTEDVAPNPVTGNVLTNDSDADGNSLVVTNAGTFVLSHGILALDSNGAYSFTLDNSNAEVQALNAGQTLADSFTYNISDGHGGTDSALVQITIHGADEPVVGSAPIANDDYYIIGAGAHLVLTAPGVLSNDTDADGDPISLGVVVTNPTHGNSSIGANGAVSYTPDPGFIGTDTFTYKAIDGAQFSNIATVTINVVANSAVPLDNYAPALALNKQIVTTGIYPTQDTSGSAGSLGMIHTFAGNFVLAGGAAATDGHLLSIAENEALFNLIGTTYGGDGLNTFATPGLSGRTSLGVGQGPGLHNVLLGEVDGSPKFGLFQTQLTPSAGGNSAATGDVEPSLGTNYLITLEGYYPSRDGTQSANGDLLGSIVEFAGNFAPRGYAICAGQILPINQFAALFSILGTTYGGNGLTTFALPDLRGRSIIGDGAGYALGQSGGEENHIIVSAEMPTDMGGQGHALNNMQPYLAMNYLIAVQGFFPGHDGGFDSSGLTPTMGEVMAFAGNFTPDGFLPCDGRLLQIQPNVELFSILGTTYGGDGITTFALPDLRGRSVVDFGQGPGLDDVSLGQQIGSETLTLASNNIPALNISGAGGDDTLYGGAAFDTINAAGGADHLTGGRGADTLTGGPGADAFVYASASQGGDIITDFTPGEDKIQVSASGFGGGLVLNGVADLIAASAPVVSAAHGQFLYDTDDGRLLWDADGTGALAPNLIATLTGAPALTASDFILG